jgi:hypothetical protein
MGRRAPVSMDFYFKWTPRCDSGLFGGPDRALFDFKSNPAGANG